jgi:Uma2 family endonuclease
MASATERAAGIELGAISGVAALAEPARPVAGDPCVALRDVGWKGYLTLLRLRGERPMPRMVYLDGTAWLMSPSFPHERLKTRLGMFVTEVVFGLEIPFVPAASTTLRRRAKKGGVEGDQSYYLANEERMRGKTKIDLRNDPPPDLAIEAVWTHEADKAVEVYRRIRVPEVWICDDAELVILILQADGTYARSTISAAFPFLSAAEIHDWVTKPQASGELEWMKSLHAWVLDTLRPRFRGRAGDAEG